MKIATDNVLIAEYQTDVIYYTKDLCIYNVEKKVDNN